jgi:hypothetical protein
MTHAFVLWRRLRNASTYPFLLFFNFWMTVWRAWLSSTLVRTSLSTVFLLNCSLVLLHDLHEKNTHTRTHTSYEWVSEWILFSFLYFVYRTFYSILNVKCYFNRLKSSCHSRLLFFLGSSENHLLFNASVAESRRSGSKTNKPFKI